MARRCQTARHHHHAESKMSDLQMNRLTTPNTSPEPASNKNAARTLRLIGKRIREMRKIRAMTLQQLAESSGISASMLSLVERGLASPSIGSLIVVTEALGKSMSELLATDDHSLALVVRGSEVQPVRTLENVVRRLMKEDRNNGISIAVNEYAPKSASNDAPISHDGYEYGLLIAGTLTIEVDGVSHVIKAGDLISYSSRRPHRIWNHSNSVARTVWVNTYGR